MKVVYLGYDVLIGCLEAICESGHEIMQIYTVPSNNSYDQCEVLAAFGTSKGIPVFEHRFTIFDMESLIKNGCELLVCAGYPYKVPVDPRLPAINFHPSLLPFGRGPWPMPVTILKNLAVSGVTLHKMGKRFDTGDILLQESFAVSPNETLLTLTEIINESSVRLIKRCLNDFERLYAQAVPQEGESTYWPEPSSKEQTIRLEMSDAQMDRILRAFAGYGCLLETSHGTVTTDMYYFRELRLSDREQVQKICSENGNTMSAYAFATLYCWRETLHLSICMEQDWFVIRMGENDYYYPCGCAERTAVFLRMLRYHDHPFRLGYVTAEIKAQLEREHPELVFAAAREDADYVVPM